MDRLQSTWLIDNLGWQQCALVSSDAINQVCNNLQLTKCINECMGLGKHICKCANVLVYNLLFPLAQQTFTICILGIEILSYSLIFLWGEYSIFTLCCSCSQSLQLSFLIPPDTYHHWVGRGSKIWEACPTPLTWLATWLSTKIYSHVAFTTHPKPLHKLLMQSVHNVLSNSY